MTDATPSSKLLSCDICGEPATQLALRDPFGKSDAKVSYCGKHGLQFRVLNQPKLEVPQISSNLETQLRDTLEWLYDKWENGTPCYEDADNTGVSLGNAFRLSAEEEAAILALIPEKCTNPTLAVETSNNAARCLSYWRHHANRCMRPRDHEGECYYLTPGRAIMENTDFQPPPVVVTDRMQGVDCPDCENGMPHTHAQKASAHAEEPSVMGAAGFPPPMPTPQDAIEAHVREIQILCDAANLDPAFYLSDNAAGGCF